MVKKLWSNDHKACMEVQHAITFDPKLQIGPLFLQHAPYDQYFPNQTLHCMKLAHMIICPCMNILEGKWRIQILLIIHEKYQCHCDLWMILSDSEPCMCTVHV